MSYLGERYLREVEWVKILGDVYYYQYSES